MKSSKSISKTSKKENATARKSLPKKENIAPKQEVQHKRRKKPLFNKFSIYIYKVLKTVHKDLAISKSGMSVMNSMLLDIMERIALESRRLSINNKKCTLGAREVQTAASLILPGELSKHALTEGSRATTKYLSSIH